MGMLAALFWGATDFLVGVNARAVGIRRAVFFGQLLGLMIMSVILLCSSEYSRIFSASHQAILFGVIASLFTLTGALSISKAFAIGKTAVVAPLVTSYGVFTTLFSWASGEQISITQFIGISICVVGVILTSLKGNSSNTELKQHNNLSIFFAVLSALLYGSSFWLQGKFALPSLGAITMLWLGYTVGLILISPALLRSSTKAELKLPPRKALIPLCAASIFNLGGFSAFSWGALNGSISVVTIISTLSGGIAALMGFAFYKEKLSLLQLGGILLVLGGAVVLHAYG